MLHTSMLLVRWNNCQCPCVDHFEIHHQDYWWQMQVRCFGTRFTLDQLMSFLLWLAAFLSCMCMTIAQTREGNHCIMQATPQPVEGYGNATLNNIVNETSNVFLLASTDNHSVLSQQEIPINANITVPPNVIRNKRKFLLSSGHSAKVHRNDHPHAKNYRFVSPYFFQPQKFK